MTFKNKFIEINFVNRSRHRPGLCRFCVEPVVSDFTVSHVDKEGHYVTDYCCAMCAIGWREIGDINDDLTI